MIRHLFVSLLLTTVGSSAAFAASLSVQISGLSNDMGLVRCGLFSGSDGWREESRAVRMINAGIERDKAVCVFKDVSPGTYAVAVFHAEHGEDRVTYGFLGKPRQGVGFSNNPSITFGAPGFDEASFKLGQSDLHLSIEMKY